MRKHTPCRVINHPILWRIDNLYYASPDRSTIGRGSLISRTYGVCTDSNRIQWGGELAYCVIGSLDGSWSLLWYTTFLHTNVGKVSADQGGSYNPRLCASIITHKTDTLYPDNKVNHHHTAHTNKSHGQYIQYTTRTPPDNNTHNLPQDSIAAIKSILRPAMQFKNLILGEDALLPVRHVSIHSCVHTIVRLDEVIDPVPTVSNRNGGTAINQPSISTQIQSIVSVVRRKEYDSTDQHIIPSTLGSPSDDSHLYILLLAPLFNNLRYKFFAQCTLTTRSTLHYRLVK